MTIIKLLIIAVFCTLFFQINFGQNKELDSLWNVYNNAKHDTSRIILLNEEIGYLYETINIDSAISFYNKAISIADKNINKDATLKINFLLLKATSLRYIGIVNIDNGNYENAFEYYNNSLEIYTDLKDYNGMSACYTNIGNYFFHTSNFENAIECFNKALKIDEKLNNKKNISKCFTNIGNVYTSIGNYDKAIEYLLKSLKIKEDLKDKKGMSNCYNNIGVIHKEQRNYDKAIEFFSKSLAIDEEIGDKAGASYCITNIGNVYKNQGANDNALIYYFKALDFFEKTGDKKGMTSCYGNIGGIYVKIGNNEKASEFYLKSLKVSEELGYKEGIAHNYFNLAILNAKLSEAININQKQRLDYLYKSTEFGLKSFHLAKEVNALPRIKDAAEILMDVYKNLGDYKKTVEFAEVYISIKDSMFNEDKTKALAEMGTKYETEKKQLQIDNLEKDNMLKLEENNKQKIVIYSFVLGFVIILVFSIFLFRLFIQKKKANKQLALKNIEVEQKNEEITAQRDEISAQRDLVTIQKAEIEQIHEELTDSINYAKRIQDAVLPVSEEYRKIMGDHFVFFRPKDVVSGDFYWTAMVENTLIVAVADCTGHGVPGAFMSMMGISFLNEIVRKKEIVKASDVLNELRKEIINALKQKGESGEQKDGMDISLIAIELQVPSYELQDTENENINTLTPKHSTSIYKAQWAGANNPLYLIKRLEDSRLEDNESQSLNLSIFESSNSTLVEIKADKMPIAIYERMDEFTNHEIELHKGDMIYLFTDGYADQFGGEKGKKFMYKNFKELLLANSQKSMNEQKVILEETLIDWIGNGEQIDDITIVGLKV